MNDIYTVCIKKTIQTKFDFKYRITDKNKNREDNP